MINQLETCCHPWLLNMLSRGESALLTNLIVHVIKGVAAL